MTIGAPSRARAAKAAIAPVAPSQATWPGPKTDVSRTMVAGAGCRRQASSPSRFEERVGVRRRVDGGAHGGRVDEPAAVLEAALEEVERRAGVLADRPRRMPGATAPGRDAREVEDGVAAGEELARGGVADVDLGRPRGPPLGAARPREPDDLVPIGLEEPADPRAEEPGRAGDDELHGRR